MDRYSPTSRRRPLVQSTLHRPKKRNGFDPRGRTPTESDIREQMLHIGTHWLRWPMSCPEKRRTLAHLGVSADISSERRKIAHRMMAGIASSWSRAAKTVQCAMLRWGSSLH
jgi:hypothetical protein